MSIPLAFFAPAITPYTWILIVVIGLVINRFSPLRDPPEPVGDEIRG